MNPLESFIEYCIEFYNDKDGVWPVADEADIIAACKIHFGTRSDEFWKAVSWTSDDREAVLAIMKSNNVLTNNSYV